MSDWNEDLDGPEPGTPADLRAKLEQANKDAERLAAEKDAEIAERDRALAFARAGIDTDTPAGQIFARGYDGDLEADAIKTAASAMGLVDAPAAPADPADPEAAAEAAREQQLLTQSQTLGGTPPPADPVAKHPAEAAEAIHAQAVADGSSNDEAVGFAFNSLVNAAQNGDQRVVIPSQ